MADIRDCEQCGASFAPHREHARFCSAHCRVAWNREHASHPTAETAALDWSIAAMKEITDRLGRVGGGDRANGFAVISEAVWWVTMVDATLVRYRPDSYGCVLSDLSRAQRRTVEETFAGLRFVRNRMGYDADHADFIQPLDSHPGAAADPIATWTWKPVPEPELASLTQRGQEWEMRRYRAYQAQLAGHPVGETFSQATEFLRVAAESASFSPA
jgi:hypothetical protein